MKIYDQYKRLVQILAAAIIICINTTIYMIYWFLELSPDTGVFYWRRGNWVIAALYILLTLFFGRMYGGFRMGYLERSNVIFSQILAMLFVNVVTYVQLALLAYSFPSIWTFTKIFLFQIAAAILWAYVYGGIYKILFPPRKVLLVYGNENSLSLTEKMKKRKDRYSVEKVISVTEGFKTIMDEALKYEGIIICDVPTADRNEILKACFDSSIRVYMTPKISDILVKSSEEMHTFDTPLLLSRNNGLTIEQRFGKRCMDIIISMLIAVITSPIMLLTAIAVKCYDRGPVIYKQKRLTIDHKEFLVYKFRSMRTDAEKDGVAQLAKEYDDRITPIGRIIRTMRIDELPQVFNIIKGDMSLVGPRPERPELVLKYEEEIPQFKSRLKVKAGLTGYAQIYGKYNTTAYDKLKLDLTYIQNYSMYLDIKLIILTIKILFMKDSSEGIQDDNIQN